MSFKKFYRARVKALHPEQHGHDQGQLLIEEAHNYGEALSVPLEMMLEIDNEVLDLAQTDWKMDYIMPHQQEQRITATQLLPRHAGKTRNLNGSEEHPFNSKFYPEVDIEHDNYSMDYTDGEEEENESNGDYKSKPYIKEEIHAGSLQMVEKDEHLVEVIDLTLDWT